VEISNWVLGAYEDSFIKVVDWVNFDIGTFSILILINFSGQSEGGHRACFSWSFENSGIFNFFLKFQFTIFGLFLFCKANGARIVLCARWPRVVELSS